MKSWNYIEGSAIKAEFHSDFVVVAEVMAEDFGISKEVCDLLYDCAGELIPEDADQITIEKHRHLFSDSVHIAIQKVLSEHPLPFTLMDFQLLTIHALGSLKNVILISPTGRAHILLK